MELSSGIQEALIAIICTSDEKCAIALSMVPATKFDPYYKNIAIAADDYIKKYQRAPGEHTLDLFQTVISKDEEAGEIYERIFESIQATKEDINTEYVLEQAGLFARYQSVKGGIARALDALQNEDPNHGVMEAESILSKSAQVSTDLFDSGIKLTDYERMFAFLNEERRAFLTGIQQVDDRQLGPMRKRLHVMVACPGRGKSWWLAHVAKMGLLERRKVLLVTLELDEEEVMQRIMQSLFSVTKRKQKVKRAFLDTDENGRLLEIETDVVTDRPSFNDKDIQTNIAARVEKLKTRKNLIIKQFPTSNLSCRQLDAYLDILETTENFIPDLVLVDYAGLMKLDENNLRGSMGQLWKELRGIAVKRNLAMVSAHQANREAESARLITARYISEDISLLHTADVVMSYNQTHEEHGLGLCRLHMMKGRTDADKFTCVVSQAYAMGQFCLGSSRMSQSYFGQLGHPSSIDDEDEDEGD